MLIRLRIPLILLTLGLMSGIFQLFSSFLPENYIYLSFIFLLPIGIAIYVFEKTNLAEKKVPLSFGILLVVVGVITDFIMK
ncbi:hypothetical protein [Bacillus sp. B-jedd]|uniref:hypothetical protein n=1 Tax=Bacillus sp. B-jedd TaxID=1476857 RepID=UPI00051557D7|nr:hypothetical protein [Bacillus sp. B-jedd]CEG29816.1 hypothetical protein BN1002_04777 [Bacillus sp. B-jedd]